jgi:probable rRNA maturation factor
MTLILQNPARSRSLPAAATLRRWAGEAIRGPAEVTVRVVGTAEGRRLNRDFRGKDYATNVLSFAYGKASGTAALAGDLVLCAPVVRAEARAQHKPLDAHYAHLLVHGLLHLQGYDHEDDEAARRMERLERRILARLGFADPYRPPEESRT